MNASCRTITCILVVLAVGAGAARANGSGAAARVAPALDPTFCEQTLHGQVWARTELYFGLSRAGGPDITDDEFEHFLDTVVTPRFPDGLTLLTGIGQFRGSDGVITQERSKLLILFYPWNEARNRAIQRIRSIYKRDFDQEAVLRADEQSCVSF